MSNTNLNTNETTPSAKPRTKGKPPAFSTYFKDPETKANIPLGAIWENTMPDGNILYAMSLGNTFERDPAKPKYGDDKESFLNLMEKFYDGELYLNAAHSANRAGGGRAAARQMLAQSGTEGAEGGKKEGWVTRVVKALFNL